MFNPREMSSSFYATAVSEWERLKSNGAFWDAYAPVALLDDTQRQAFLLHDYRNALTPNLLRFQIYTPATHEQLKPIFEHNERLSAATGFDSDILNSLIGDIDALPIVTGDSSRPGYNKVKSDSELLTLRIFKRILPALSASVQFLEHPSAFHLSCLMLPTVTANELGHLFNARVHTRLTSYYLRGIDLIPIFNLLHNASRHHQLWQMEHHDTGSQNQSIELHIPEPGAFIVVNRSLHELPKDRNILQPGIQGTGGSKGYGLTIANLYVIIAGSMLERESHLILKRNFSQEDKHRETHTVTFWIKPRLAHTQIDEQPIREQYLHLPQYGVLYDPRERGNGRYPSLVHLN